MLKLALIGDLHLSERSPRYQHTLDVLDHVVEEIEVERGEWNCKTAFALLGDLFEGKPTPREYRDLIDRLQDMRDVGDVYVVLGNHEDHEALSFFNALSTVTGVVHVAWDGIVFAHIGEARLMLIPYPRRGRAPFDDLEDDGTIAGSINAATKWIHDEVAARAREQWRGPLIVLGHFTVEGMTTRDAEFEQHNATEVVVPRAAFDGVALTAVGHIHRAQDVAPKIIGVGGLIRHSFAEAQDPKSFTLVTVHEGQVTWERRPVPARDMRVGEIAWPIDAVSDELLAEIRGKEVKLTVNIQEDLVATFDPAVFEPIREAAALFVLEKRTVSSARTRAPQLSTTDDLPAQITRWGEAIGETIDVERLRAKVAEVEA